jgi:hypothetical protein
MRAMQPTTILQPSIQRLASHGAAATPPDLIFYADMHISYGDQPRWRSSPAMEIHSAQLQLVCGLMVLQSHLLLVWCHLRRRRHVTELDLSSAGITGTLHAFCSTAYQNLTVLDHNYNSLTGAIPTNISLLVKLTYLNFFKILDN